MAVSVVLYESYSLAWLLDRAYPDGYNWLRMEIRQTHVFAAWMRGLRDVRAKARILTRIERLAGGNPGDSQSVGRGVHELRVDYGPGYRVYYKRNGPLVVVLLAGGDKRSQSKDIKMAFRLACAL